MVTVVLVAYIALRSSHQFSKIIILKPPPLQKDLLVILLFYPYWNISSLLVNQLHCHSHKHQNPSHFIKYSHANLRTHTYSSWHGLQIPWCINIFLNNIYQYYCFLNMKHKKAQAHASKPPPFMTHPGIMKELTSMMQTWLMNDAACPPAVRQESNNTLNLLDIDFWLWYWKVTPKGMACAFKIKFWDMSNGSAYTLASPLSVSQR